MDFVDILKQRKLPADFGPSHPRWSTPSLNQKYRQCLNKADELGIDAPGFTDELIWRPDASRTTSMGLADILTTNKMIPTIVIPSVKTREDLQPMVEYVASRSPGCPIVAQCDPTKSAAENRNAGMKLVNTKYIVMIDDDIFSLYDGWWRDLVLPLETDLAFMTSARFVDGNGHPGEMNGSLKDTSGRFETVETVPSACIAFKKCGVEFDERFKGSGFEDTQFCDCMRKENPDGTIVIVNSCTVMHANEMKNQKVNFKHNSELYAKLKRGEA